MASYAQPCGLPGIERVQILYCILVGYGKIEKKVGRDERFRLLSYNPLCSFSKSQRRPYPPSCIHSNPFETTTSLATVSFPLPLTEYSQASLCKRTMNENPFLVSARDVVRSRSESLSLATEQCS